MSSHTTCNRRVSIGESGLTTLELAVSHDEQTSIDVTIEETLPASVHPERVAATTDTGTWTVTENESVQWSVTVGPNQVAKGTIGFEIVDPNAVDELADGTTTTMHVRSDGEASTPAVEAGEGRPAAKTLADVSSTRRVPEAVYERVRTVDADTVTASAQERIPAQAASSGETEAGDCDTDSAEMPSTEPTDEAPAADGDGDADDSQSVMDDEWHGDSLENAIRRTDVESRATETAYRFVLAFESEDTTDLAIEILEGLLNGTTVFVAEPPLSELREGATPTELTATISSAVCEESVVGALEAIEGTTLEYFETLDTDATDLDDLASDPSHRFELLADVVDSESYEAFADEVDAIDDCAFDFGAEPVSFEDLVEQPDVAARDAAAADSPVNDGGQTDGVERTESGHRRERVVERLIDELEAGGITEHERVELRRRLGVDPPTSTAVRLDHLESRVEEFAAYSDALATFLDEEGTAQTILERIREEVSTVEDRMTALETAVEETQETAATEREAIVEDVLDLERSQSSTRDDVDDLGSTLAAEQERLDELARAVGSNTDDIEHLANDVRESIAALEATAASLESDVDTLEARIDDLEADLETRMDALERNVAHQLEELDERVDDQLQTMTNRLDERLESHDERIDERLESLDDRLDERFDSLDDRIDQKVDALDDQLEKRVGSLEKQIDDRVESLDDSVDERLSGLAGSMTERVDDLEGQVEENARVRKQLEKLAK